MIPAAFAQDSFTGEYGEGEGHYTENIKPELENGDAEDEYVLRYTVDKEFLKDPSTVYPVIIDPTAYSERRYLTFDMNNPRHTEALVLFSAQSGKLRSEYVIDCILKAQQGNGLEEVIRQTISEALATISLSGLVNSEAPTKLRSTDKISDLPEALICAMDDI